MRRLADDVTNRLTSPTVDANKRGNESGMSGVTTHQQSNEGYRGAVVQTMEDAGQLETRSGRMARLGHVCRKHIFKGLKFIHDSQLDVGGKLAERVRVKMEYGANDANYNVAWREWKAKAVRRFINERRSACAQSIGNAILKGKALSYCFSLYLRHFL